MNLLVGIVLVVLMLAVIGWLVNLITTKIAMDDTFKQMIVVVVVIAVVIVVLGFLTGRIPLPTLPIGH